MLNVHQLITGPLQENTYAIVNETSQALIVDPGNDAEYMIDWIRQNGWQPIAVLLTHGHFDHIGALDAVRRAFNIEAYIHPLEQEFVTNPELNLSALWNGDSVIQQPIEHLWQEMGMQQVGSFQFKVAFVPGHSPGHVVYIFDENRFVIGGDTVFAGGIGRTDLPQGSYVTLMQGIAKEIISLPHDYVIYSGHGNPTTIATELATNPYFEVFRNLAKHNLG